MFRSEFPNVNGRLATKRKQYSVEQIVAALKQAELGMPVPDQVRHRYAQLIQDFYCRSPAPSLEPRYSFISSITHASTSNWEQSSSAYRSAISTMEASTI
ncbi:hypothetical protein DIE06_30610 [Burkholderia sp. Bp8998]|nr:hypothetical protein DIE06_30610 [Burkholderia sp. Bp8998]